MSSPLDSVQELLLAYYASKGRFPRPQDVTQNDIDAVKRLTASVSRQLSMRITGRPAEKDGLEATIHRLDEQVNIYEESTLLELARQEIPLEQLKATAKETQEGENPLPGDEDALAEALVKWFKPTYFKWIDPIKCIQCQGDTRSTGMVSPTQDELQGGAQRVEAHQCKRCATVVRFPRFNDLRYLMRSREGRCGEFANLFALFVRAVGLRGRYVWNAEDHVWNEYYSPALNRWVHMDSCENARDQPLLYDVGWGKKQSYILAFSTEGAQDVSRGYIKDFAAALSRRTRITEDDLQRCLAEVTARRRAGLSTERLKELEYEDQGELRFLLGIKEEEPLPARQSGTAEWKADRGEDGKGDAS